MYLHVQCITNVVVIIVVVVVVLIISSLLYSMDMSDVVIVLAVSVCRCRRCHHHRCRLDCRC